MLGSISKVYPPPIENIMHCVGRSVNGNGFCQCLFVELICCPHILETDAHTLTLHCVRGGNICTAKKFLYNPACYFLPEYAKINMENSRPTYSGS